jgi:uncharacterized protein (TIGR00290 family)
MPRRILLSWSTGKDSAWALHVLRTDPSFEVCGLLTTIDATHDRVAVHAVSSELLTTQSAAVGLSLRTVFVPQACSNRVYEACHHDVFAKAAAEGIEGVAFGDLHLADIRVYRERLLEAVGLQAHFPLWGMSTRALARSMVDAGLRALLTCVDPERCPRELAGQEFGSVLERLPPTIDPCGENGEFHTFAYAGPMFAQPLRVEAGPVVEREGFVFADVVSVAEPEETR